MTPDDPTELDRFDRERREADARYNDALTALDGAIVAAGVEPARADVERVATALLVFLQQITAFVESKDRQLAAEVRARVGTIAQTLEPMAELRTQVGVLQRATDALRRTAAGHQSSVVSTQPPRLRSPEDPASDGEARQSAKGATAAAPSPFSQDDYKYAGFEDQFRGSDQAIQERLLAYVPIFEGRSDVLDIGCGRGELLSVFKASGIRARGIDANNDMAAIARERGLEATHADALGYVASLPEASLGGVIATQVVEHLEPSYLMRLLDAAARALQPGAPIVLETINAACWLAFFSSYIRDFTHVRPVHPETLQYLLRASGFERVEIRYSAPVPEPVKMKTIDLPADVLGSPESSSKALAQIARTLNANAVVLNNLMFTHLDYAAVGYRV
jgi:2-polyprenyl-3-methyl-5-hydroxy-6-metoxy-1,4-benzoquinol methylase